MSKDNSFWIRLRSGVILVAFMIVIMILGGYPLAGVLAAVSLTGLMELYRVMNIHKTVLGFAGYAFCLLWYAAVVFGKGIFEFGKVMPLFAAAYILIVLAVYVLSFPKYKFDQMMTAFFGIFYVAVTLSYIYLVRIQPHGRYCVWLVFLCSWGADTSAYVFGKLFGKHHVAPVLSPKKTLEGCIGGVFGAAALSALFAVIFKEQLVSSFSRPVLSFIIIAAIASVVSMIGDLAASAIKRDKEIKDYGKLIPGHGGILDRFDSVIFIAPIVYYLLQYLGV